ncbi:bacillithiol biosynthesis cysteine-adding enzyme BshC [Staphylococcus epidermidis]|uniref:bacillithiol biosynthesis cysteine-adding enzyme BshC n=1 Tax=Staphylococcus epidermidis TaxID=1282 RepID=UPI0008075DB9|nr:bacillithiol biosynthesis cysteine-adding enzyme BshC [Staphylococcus epidermidis]MBC3036348.1 bacillithiol biosynthesis cysteine-adding enzyme BshC [Staphylococcus epidermidis]MBC3088124.1 bacillithiol biosynthesis cysteine-adding enzyme BshC [Staphylococcus epidermidis]MDH8724455.1 bacillithiol biosynthesis cysteine-adding enzyme BshC [Staphylococcus epidermidis]MDH8892688.1 bacillithiol biosynthesis cysteine-adding enzyme BshC [Staphylococcus epidermidis]MDH8898042.1 bacillithiol biosynt
MKCNTLKLTEQDQFINKIKNSESQITSFYEYDAAKKESFYRRLKTPNNGREFHLSRVIKSYMNELKLTHQQLNNIDALADGAKVVIGGQQAGLFGGPLYTFHKIFSIITLSRQLSEEYDTPIVPVFWIAGEDHDFEEVNHTYAFNNKETTLKKVKYHTMTPPDSNVSRYTPDKNELKASLNHFFKEMKETVHTQDVYQMCVNIINQFDSWTDIFKGLIHEVFKDYGILLIDAQYPELRQMEKPLFKEILEKRNQVDQSFRETQIRTTQQQLPSMIQTETNTHLFIHEDGMRQLLNFDGTYFKLNKTEKRYTKQNLLDIIEREPERISNNVVTRPVVEEWLFNTVAFIGGPSEIKYWAELKGVFDTLNVEMPIVMPRLRITYLYARTKKLLKQYNLSIESVIANGVEQERQRFVREKASNNFINEVEEMKIQQQELYNNLFTYVENNHDNQLLLEKNNQIHLNQYDYLIKRYLLNIERENDISMRQFREISETLHPMGGLQERVWNPLQIMNDFGIDVFSPSTYPPLSYSFDHLIIKP